MLLYTCITVLKGFKEMKKSSRVLEWAVAFWVGTGLMSIINVWKIIQGRNPIIYSWIMFFISGIFIITCIILLAVNKNHSRNAK